MRIFSLLAPLLALAAPLAAQIESTAAARRVADDVRLLAADSLAGRKTCTPENEAAARWLAEQLRREGVRPAGDGGTFLQRWTVGNTSATREAGIAGCETMNVVGAIPGRGVLAGHLVIVGAHLDHLGRGGFGSRMPADSGRIHNGADDNASGTAGVLELARALRRDRRSRDSRPFRTVLLAFWNGEEAGALGSRYFAERLPAPRESVLAYINFDMVGRLREGRLLALGARTAEEWPALLDSVNATHRFDLRASGDGWGPSDHASFYALRLPVLHLFTDLHEDYHRPGDDAAAINADGIARVAAFAADLVIRLGRRSAPLTFVDAPPPAPAAGPAGRPRPSLGTIPDMADEPGGVRLSGVRAGSPADSAGLRAGDVLIGLGEHAIANLQDFQNALMAQQAGQRVEVRFRRGDQVISVTVTLR